MHEPRYVLMTVELAAEARSIDGAARALGVEPSAIDASYGVVLVDPRDGKCAVRVAERELDSAPKSKRKGVGGPFSDPRIEPFGPPRP